MQEIGVCPGVVTIAKSQCDSRVTTSSKVTTLSESVKCRFSKCRFSALNLKFDFISDGGCTREKQIQKALGSVPPCGNRCRFSESAICSSRMHPPSEIKSNFKFKTLRWRPRKKIVRQMILLTFQVNFLVPRGPGEASSR